MRGRARYGLVGDKRFIALTGIDAVGDAGLELTDVIADIVARYFPPKHGHQVDCWTYDAVDGYGGPTDDEALIRAGFASSRRSAAAAFGNNAVTFADLFNADADKLAARWPQQGGGYDASKADYTPGRLDILRRVPAAPIEAIIIERIARLVQRGAPLDWSEAAHILKRVEIRERSVHLLLDVSASLEPHEPPEVATARLKERMEIGDAIVVEAAHMVRLICDWTPLLRGGRSWNRTAEGGSVAATRSSDPTLVTCLRAAHAALEKHNASPLHPDHHVNAQAAIDQRGRRMMTLGLLAPDLQRAILATRGLAGLSANKILSINLPIGWADQRRVLESLAER